MIQKNFATTAVLIALCGATAFAQPADRPRALWADFDGDGTLDLYLVDAEHGDRLLLDSAGELLDRTTEANLDPRAGTALARTLDLDGRPPIDLGGPGRHPELHRVDPRPPPSRPFLRSVRPMRHRQRGAPRRRAGERPGARSLGVFAAAARLLLRHSLPAQRRRLLPAARQHVARRPRPAGEPERGGGGESRHPGCGIGAHPRGAAIPGLHRLQRPGRLLLELDPGAVLRATGLGPAPKIGVSGPRLSSIGKR